MLNNLSVTKKIIFTSITLLLAVSLPFGLYLIQQPTEIYQRAQDAAYPTIPPPDCRARAIGMSNKSKSVAYNNSNSNVLGDIVENCGYCIHNGSTGCIPVCYDDATCELMVCDLCANTAVCNGNPPPPPGPSTTPRPVCNDTCMDISNCLAGDTCYFPPGQTTGQCRNAGCINEPSCICASPSPVPSSTPGSIMCTDIKVYKVNGTITDSANWQQLTSSQLPSLTAGEIIYITVLGTSANTTIDRARIRVNSSTWTSENETTNLKPNSQEYYVSYTIPSGTTNFTFESEIHDQITNVWQ